MSTKVLGFSVLGLILAGLAYWFIASTNAEARVNELKQAHEALVQRQGVKHDEMWKGLAGIAQVDKQNDDMQQIYYDAWKDAISKGSNLATATESVFPMLFQQASVTGPQTEIKMKLANKIEDYNSEFTSYREDVLAACQAYNTYVQDPWNKYFLSDDLEKEIDCIVITSTRTQNAVESGVDDNNTIYE